jgi:hypothetical protein
MDDLSHAKKLLEIGDKNGALKEIARILISNPSNIEAWLLCAHTIEDINHKKDCYRAVLRLDPNNIQAERELKILLSTSQAITKPNLVSKDSTKYRQMVALSKSKTKRKDFLQVLVSDRVFKIAVSIMVGFILLIFGISSLGRTIKSAPLQPSPIPLTPNLLTPIRITQEPTNGSFQKIPPTPKLTPIPTQTRIPTFQHTATKASQPTITPFFPELTSVGINNDNYPEIYNPLSLIQNPEEYRNQRFHLTLRITRIIYTTIDGEEQWIISLGSLNYPPLLVFGLKSDYPYRSDPEQGDLITVYGIGMGGVDLQTIDNVFGQWILPLKFYPPPSNWSVPCMFGEYYFIAQL